MHHLIMAIAMTEHIEQTRRESDLARHTATARALRQEGKATSRTSRQDPYLSFLPRLIGYPAGR